MMDTRTGPKKVHLAQYLASCSGRADAPGEPYKQRAKARPPPLLLFPPATGIWAWWIHPVTIANQFYEISQSTFKVIYASGHHHTSWQQDPLVNCAVSLGDIHFYCQRGREKNFTPFTFSTHTSFCIPQIMQNPIHQRQKGLALPPTRKEVLQG